MQMPTRNYSAESMNTVRAVILIPTFNSRETIAATLESIQVQRLPLAECISAVYLADDCSSDDTIEVARAIWHSTVPLWVLPARQNLGERGNINRALELIEHQPEWVLILHSDDVAKQNWLELMIARINACPADTGSICSSWDDRRPDGTIIPGDDDPGREIEYIAGTINAVVYTLGRGCWWHVSGCAIRKKTLDRIGGFDVGLPQLGDWEWLLRCLAHGWAIEYIPRTLIVYRQHQTTVSSRSFQIDRDIRESLPIICTYVAVLSRKQLLALHTRRMYYIARRMLRAISKFSRYRLVMAGQTLLLVARNLVKCWALHSVLQRAARSRVK
jgi:GT2 family glycosyltransferase